MFLGAGDLTEKERTYKYGIEEDKKEPWGHGLELEISGMNLWLLKYAYGVCVPISVHVCKYVGIDI